MPRKSPRRRSRSRKRVYKGSDNRDKNFYHCHTFRGSRVTFRVNYREILEKLFKLEMLESHESIPGSKLFDYHTEDKSYSVFLVDKTLKFKENDIGALTLDESTQLQGKPTEIDFEEKKDGKFHSKQTLRFKNEYPPMDIFVTKIVGTKEEKNGLKTGTHFVSSEGRIQENR